MEYTPQTKKILSILQEEWMDVGCLWPNRVFLKMMQNLNPAESRICRHLLDPSVYPESSFAQLLRNAKDGKYEPSGGSYCLFVKKLEEIVKDDRCPTVLEYHVVKTLFQDGSDFARLPINSTRLVELVAKDSGIQIFKKTNLRYIFLDTNILIHCKPLSDDSWKNDLSEFEKFVIPISVVKELDLLKLKTTKEKHRRIQKNFSAFREISKIYKVGSLEQEDGAVYIYPLEPAFSPASLDLAVQDDRHISSILDFGWRNRGVETQLMTLDYSAEIKAKSVGVQLRKVPETIMLTT